MRLVGALRAGRSDAKARAQQHHAEQVRIEIAAIVAVCQVAAVARWRFVRRRVGVGYAVLGGLLTLSMPGVQLACVIMPVMKPVVAGVPFVVRPPTSRRPPAMVCLPLPTSPRLPRRFLFPRPTR